MKTRETKNYYYQNEEFWNTFTHAVGVLLSVAALVLLVVYSTDKVSLASGLVFGISLIVLYTASTVYHWITHPKWKKIFQKIDHLSIYILIAGTYTPVCLLGIKGAWGWMVFGIAWVLALIGFVFKFSPLQKYEKLSLILYVAMGWMAVIAIKPLIENVDPYALMLILFGGLSYTFGIYFFANERIPFNHSIWHLFVIGGSLLHFFAIFFYVF